MKKCLAVDVADRYVAVIEVTNALGNIDGHELDWQYEVFPDGVREWAKASDGRVLTLSVTAEGKSSATKRTDKTTSRIRDFCVQEIDERTIRNFLKEH